MIGSILHILGSLAFFIFGMKMMSEGIQRAAGAQLRGILSTMTQNRYLGVFTGFLITAILQSSSASTVMTVSFVNAGLLSLIESAGVMMGANIGTTITGWLISVLGFKVNLSAYSIPLFAIGLPLLFSNRGKFKYWGEFIIGFAILFLGLQFLREAVPDFRENYEVFQRLKNFAESGLFSRVFFVFVGALITIIVQSSSAAMAITLTMCAQGWLSFEVAAAMILGENIGTTITAEVASLVGNVNAKRSARIHSLFNIIGVTWMVLLLPFILPIFAEFLVNFIGIENPYSSAIDMPIGLSAFHTLFNLTNVLLLIGFVPWLIRLSKWSVREVEEEDERGIKLISTIGLTPEFALIELQKETAYFGELTSRMTAITRKLIVKDKNDKKVAKAIKKLGKYEQITDNIESEITQYITRLANQELTPDTSQRLRNIVNICNDLERIGDVFFQISKTYEKSIEEGLELNSEQKQGLANILDLVEKAFEVMNNNLGRKSYDEVNLSKAKAVEAEVNEARDKLREYNLSQLGNPNYNVQTSMIFNNLFSMLEAIGDHIMTINKSIVGKI